MLDALQYILDIVYSSIRFSCNLSNFSPYDIWRIFLASDELRSLSIMSARRLNSYCISVAVLMHDILISLFIVSAMLSNALCIDVSIF